MALTKQDYLSSIFGDLQLPYRGTSMSVKDYAKQTGLGQRLEDFQDAYAASVLKGKQAGEDILKQGDKAFSSSWYEILQRALEAAALQRATGGELGTDFADSYSTMLAAMREAGAGATEQQMAYTNLANKIAELMAQSNVQAMGDYKDQAAALAAYYAELMQADSMRQQNDVNLLAQLLSEYGGNAPYYGGGGGGTPAVDAQASVIAGKAGANSTVPKTAAQTQADADAVERFEKNLNNLLTERNVMASTYEGFLNDVLTKKPSGKVYDTVADILSTGWNTLTKDKTPVGPAGGVPFQSAIAPASPLLNSVLSTGITDATSLAAQARRQADADAIERSLPAGGATPAPRSVTPMASTVTNTGGALLPQQLSSLFSVLTGNVDARRAALEAPPIQHINPLTGGDTQDEKDKKKRQQATAAQAALVRQQAAQQSIKQNSLAQALQSALAPMKTSTKKSTTPAIAALPVKAVGSSSVKGTISRNKTGATNVGQPGVWFNPGTGGGTVTGATLKPATATPDRTGAIKGPVYKFK